VPERNQVLTGKCPSAACQPGIGSHSYNKWRYGSHIEGGQL
jgi:hypothetical protein